jgi:hypothetical protein
MTNAISVATLIAGQDALHKEYEQAKSVLQEAQSLFAEKKSALVKFNNKYGRVIAMMNED